MLYPIQRLTAQPGRRSTINLVLNLMLIAFIAYVALTKVARGADDPMELIGGTVVPKEQWPASPWVGVCSSTLIGPRVLLTAAHCVAQGNIRSFNINGNVYRTGPCEHHPLYATDYSHDFALCPLAADVPVKAESVAQPFEFPCGVGTEVLWTGFGCTRWGQGIDGQFRIGKTLVEHCPGYYGSPYSQYIITLGNGVALCSGDSGGGGYAVYPDGSRRVIGVNSRSDTTVTSYVSSTVGQGFRDWASSFMIRHNVLICGMGADASKCRGTTSEPPPPPPRHNVYRHFNEPSFDHYHSQSATPPGGYRYEGAAFKLFSSSTPGRASLYRCFVPNRYGHFLSRDANCEGTGVWSEAMIGYVATTQEPGTQPLYRCYARVSSTRLHFLTTPSQDECRQAGHTVQGIQGYAPL